MVRMRSYLTPFAIYVAGSGLLALGVLLMRHARRTGAPRLEPFAWFAFIAGAAAVALLALAHLGGRFGPAQLWFRAPTFYLSVLVLGVAAGWWFLQPTPRAVRFGTPLLLVAVGAVMLTVLRLHGASAPLAMLMPTLGTPAPELTWHDESGRIRKLSELQGKVVLLNFWATWCAPCRREMPLLSQVQREYADDGFVVLYVSLEDPAVLEAFLANNKFDGLHGRLDQAAPFYDAGKFYPLSYLISRRGNVQKRWSGRPSESWLEDSIRREL